MSTLPLSPVVWIRWLSPPKGSEIGEIDRLPRVLAEVFVERGDALRGSGGRCPGRRAPRGGTAA